MTATELRQKAADLRARVAELRAEVLRRQAAGEDHGVLDEQERGFDLLAREADEEADRLEAAPACEVCGKPARERSCGGWDTHCSDRCALEGMAALMGRPAARA